MCIMAMTPSLIISSLCLFRLLSYMLTKLQTSCTETKKTTIIYLVLHQALFTVASNHIRTLRWWMYKDYLARPVSYNGPSMLGFILLFFTPLWDSNQKPYITLHVTANSEVCRRNYETETKDIIYVKKARLRKSEHEMQVDAPCTSWNATEWSCG